MGLLGDGSELLTVASRVSSAGDGPVIGGIAVFLHPLDKTFAAKLPANLHTDFKRLVDAVQTDDDPLST